MDDVIKRWKVFDAILRCTNFRDLYDFMRYMEQADMSDMHMEFEFGILCAINAVENIPGEVQTGKWKYIQYKNGKVGFLCDKCGFEVPWNHQEESVSFIKSYDYCPGCGKIMTVDVKTGDQDG